MFSKVFSAALMGTEGVLVAVEVDVRPGIPKESIVGLPDAVVRESKERIRAAIKNSGFDYPVRAYVINLAPAELRKEGPFFDLPIATAILDATHQIRLPEKSLFIGELSLNGEILPVRGIISICQMACKQGFKQIFIPFNNQIEAGLINGIEIVPVTTLSHMIDVIKGIKKVTLLKKILLGGHDSSLDFKDIKGQEHAKRAFEICAAGSHNLLLVGSPGSGKTMLCKRLPGILPEMSVNEAIETYNLRSIAGFLKQAKALSLKRPFRNPHHSISYAGMVGGGVMPRPGEISLAHNGVLFLDEIPEFPRHVLEVLRQPIEDRCIVISRANHHITYPAHFIFLAAMNPCPCGYYSDDQLLCSCQESQVKAYWKRVSGPILDRIDIILEVPRLKKEDFFKESANYDDHKKQTCCYSSADMKRRVLTARDIQFKRYKIQKTNSDMSSSEIERYCRISQDIKEVLGKAIDKGMLSGRSFDKVLQLSRTIADLEGEADIKMAYVMEAIQYRNSRINTFARQ
ncbi:YifB family Mg chelatase-like AAA ATPase [Thermoproteota archaeon]